MLHVKVWTNQSPVMGVSFLKHAALLVVIMKQQGAETVTVAARQ